MIDWVNGWQGWCRVLPSGVLPDDWLLDLQWLWEVPFNLVIIGCPNWTLVAHLFHQSVQVAPVAMWPLMLCVLICREMSGEVLWSGLHTGVLPADWLLALRFIREGHGMCPCV